MYHAWPSIKLYLPFQQSSPVAPLATVATNSDRYNGQHSRPVAQRDPHHISRQSDRVRTAGAVTVPVPKQPSLVRPAKTSSNKQSASRSCWNESCTAILTVPD